MRSWSIGDVAVTQLVEFKSTLVYDEQALFIAGAAPGAVRAIEWLEPHCARPDGRLIMSVHALLVERRRSASVGGLDDSVRPLFEAGLTTLVELDHRLCPEVRLVPTLGHTPGHVSVAIESRGERAVITGDAIHHPAQMARLDWSVRFDSDQALARATRHALLREWASAPILVIGTHFPPPTAGRVVRDGGAYRFDAGPRTDADG